MTSRRFSGDHSKTLILAISFYHRQNICMIPQGQTMVYQPIPVADSEYFSQPWMRQALRSIIVPGWQDLFLCVHDPADHRTVQTQGPPDLFLSLALCSSVTNGLNTPNDLVLKLCSLNVRRRQASRESFGRASIRAWRKFFSYSLSSLFGRGSTLSRWWCPQPSC